MNKETAVTNPPVKPFHPRPMNHVFSRLSLCRLTSAALLVAAGSAQAFPNPFKRKQPESAPAPTELRVAEMDAGDLLRQAQDQDAAGKSSAAASSYKRIVERYPLTSFAPMAQFRLASTYEREGKFSKAFTTYQELVDTYKQSPQFSEAIDRQIAIATQSRTEKLGSFLGIPKKLDRSEQLEMFEKIMGNAPRGRRAAEAQFEIAKIHEEDNAADLAISAYRKVVDDYPSSPFATEAQAKVAKGFVGKVTDGSRDASNLVRASNAADDAAGLFPRTSAPDLSSTRIQVDEIAAGNAWKTGLFYEKKGNYRAALLYFSDVLRSPGSPHFAEAKERISAMSAKDPNLMTSLPAISVSPQDLAVRAAVDLKTKPGYFGPPPPPAKVASVIRKPKLRNSGDQIPITPLEEPDLPTGIGDTLRPDDTLLNPGTAFPAPGSGDLVPGDTLPGDGVPSLEPALPGLDPPAAPAPAAPSIESPALVPPSDPLPPPSEPVVPADPGKPAN